MDIYAASEKPIEGVTAEALVERIRQFGHRSVEYVGTMARGVEACWRWRARATWCSRWARATCGRRAKRFYSDCVRRPAMARESKKSGGIRWRLWLSLAALGLACASTAVAALKLRDYVSTDPRFALSTDYQEALAIQGLHYADRAKVLNVFALDLGRTAFSVPLAERRRRLLAIDWVEDASVSRIWPDRLLVRIRERMPVAFVSFPSGPMLVDAEGVLIALPPRASFAFPVIDGLREDVAAAQRRAGVNAFLRFQRNMGYLANDVSEVDVADPNDIRIVARVEDRAVELIVGDGDFAARYQNFVSHYQEIRKESPDAGTFDLRLDDRITARN